jgi:hypothetical protein
LPVPQSAVSPALQPAGSNSACRPAIRATERLTGRAAFGRIKTNDRTIRTTRPGGPLLFASEGEADV